MKRMPKQMSALTAAVAAVALVGTVTACSGSADTRAGGRSDPLRVWIMGDTGPAFKEVVEPFTADTGIEVQVDALPWENVNDKLTTAIASGQGPDVVQVGLSLLPTLKAADALLDLADKVADYPGLARENFPSAVDPANLDPSGAVTSIPWVSDTRVLFYRTDILTEAGFDSAPTTWEEMRATATALADRGDGQYGYHIPLWDNTLPVQFTWQAGGRIAADDGTVDFHTPEFAAAVDHYLGFFQDGSVPTASDWDQAQGFISGTTPMVVSGPYLANAIRETAPELDGQWSVALTPKNAEGTSLFAGSSLSVWNTSENADDAVRLIDFLATPSTQQRWYEVTGELPANVEALNALAATGGTEMAVYVEQLDHARTVPMVPGWDLIANEMVEALVDIAVNDADRVRAMDELADRAASITSNY